MVEIERRHLVGRTVADVAACLLDRGYVCWGLRGRALVPWTEFDVRLDQTRWLDGSRITDLASYVNNFIFLPAERAGEAAELRNRLAY